MKKNVTTIINILILFLVIVILTGCVGDLTKDEDASDETLIWDVYMEYIKWSGEKNIEPMTYAEWDAIKEEMKNNPDAIQQEIARADAVLEQAAIEQAALEQAELEQTAEETTAQEEALVFATPEEETAYNKVKEFYNSLSDMEKEYLEKIIIDESMNM